MNKKVLIIKFVISLILFSVIYISKAYNTPQSLKLQNEAKYFINHNSDINYIAKHAYNNAKILAKIVNEKAGE